MNSMNETQRWIAGDAKRDLFKQDDFRQQYQLARAQGDRRFGSPCAHEQVKDGRCVNCLRNVVS